MERLKNNIQKLITSGETREAINQLIIKTNQAKFQNLRKDVLLQSSKYNRYEKDRIAGIKSDSELSLEINKINHALLSIIDRIFDKNDFSPITTSFSITPYLIRLGILLTLILGLFFYFQIFSSPPPEPPFSLVVYVHGPEGKQDIVLDNEGILMIDLDQDRRKVKIGENGRTVFSEIPGKFLNSSIPITVKMKGYSVAHPDSSFTITQKPIYYEVSYFEKKKGSVKNAKSGVGIVGATIKINNDTTVISDKEGVFSFNMKEPWRKENIQLFTKKQGYRDKEIEYKYGKGIINIDLVQNNQDPIETNPPTRPVMGEGETSINLGVSMANKEIEVKYSYEGNSVKKRVMLNDNGMVDIRLPQSLRGEVLYCFIPACNYRFQVIVFNDYFDPNLNDIKCN